MTEASKPAQGALELMKEAKGRPVVGRVTFAEREAIGRAFPICRLCGNGYAGAVCGCTLSGLAPPLHRQPDRFGALSGDGRQVSDLDRIPHHRGQQTSAEAADAQIRTGQMGRDLDRVLAAALVHFERGMWTPKMLAKTSGLDLYMIRRRCNDGLHPRLAYLEREPKRDKFGNHVHTAEHSPIYRRIGGEFCNRLTDDGEHIARMALSVAEGKGRR